MILNFGGKLMKIVEVSDDKAVENPGELFTGGKVYIQRLVDEQDSDQMSSVMVNFSAGAKNKLHTHDFDQILFVTKGKGIVATDKEQHIVTPGTLILIPANEPHWHGATDDEPFSHLSVLKPHKTQIVE
jgi:quercetin dioxygenase-like cupin family protein